MKTQKSSKMKGGGDAEADDHHRSIKDSDEDKGKQSFFDYLHKVQNTKDGNKDGEADEAKAKIRKTKIQ